MTGSGVRQLTEPEDNTKSSLPRSQFGQLRSFEQTNKRSECTSFVKVSIEDPAVIQKILAHLAVTAATALLPECRAPPVTGLLV
jgi:hypothetical protein